MGFVSQLVRCGAVSSPREDGEGDGSCSKFDRPHQQLPCQILPREASAAKRLRSNPFRLSWDEFQALPRKKVQADFHCVTSWSKLDNEWEGVPFSVIAEQARPKPEARFVMVLAENNYTANVPLEDLMRDDVLFADRHAPEPLDAVHGAPLRLIVPHLYAWKSAKWVRGLNFMAEDRPGYWEGFGYHMYGDPFREERFRR